jgi:hypothetical protein
MPYLTFATIPQCIHGVEVNIEDNIYFFTPYMPKKISLDYLYTYLHNQSSRSAGTSSFVEYRSLTGQMGYSKFVNIDISARPSLTYCITILLLDLVLLHRF